MRRHLLVLWFVIDVIAIGVLALQLRRDPPAVESRHAAAPPAPTPRTARRPALIADPLGEPELDVNTTDPSRPYVPPEQPRPTFLPPDPPPPPTPAFAPPLLDDVTH